MSVNGRAQGAILSLFRIIVGLSFACHGASGIVGVLGGATGSGHTVPAGTWPGWWAALIRFVGGILVLLGIFARPFAVLCSGSMAYAYFTVHAPKSLFPLQNSGAPAVLFCWAFLLIAVFGAEPWAIERLFSRGRADSRAPAASAAGPVG